jgi:excisionase family DNA binding protein
VPDVDTLLPIPSPLIDALADAIAVRIGDKCAENTSRETDLSVWMNAEQAASYMGDAPVSRVHDLVQQRKLIPHRDGRRLLFKRAELDAYLEGS